MFGIGSTELVVIAVVALLVLGPKRLPELARTMGRGLAEFRKASADLRQSLAIDEIQNDLREGLGNPGTIHKPVKKPEASDRPAQAGDDLASGDGAKADPASAAAPTETKHPGELPDDLDPHAHSESGDAPEATSSPAAPAAEREATPSATPADEGLGTVPVSRTATERRAPPPPSSAGTTDDERG